MNIADWIVIGVYGFSILICYRRGIILSVFRTLSWFISIGLSVLLYEPVSKLLRNQSGLFEWLQGHVAQYLALPEMENAGLAMQNQVIAEAPLPSILQNVLIENNNPVVYQILKTETLTEYISGYVANICINILSVLLVLIVVRMILFLIESSLGILSKLPVINGFNKIGGIIFGVFQGTLFIWLFFFVILFFIHKPFIASVISLILEGKVSSFLFEYNLLWQTILKVFP